MSFGFGFALPHWQTLSGGFTPASLFSAGEQGAWYDPSDLSTLFQDSAGGTPVTAVEQPVGRMLDKSGRGNHATQSTSTSRPVLRARYNLLTYSEQFDNAAWTKTNLITTGTPPWVNVAVAPDGTTTADFAVPNTTSGQHFVSVGSIAPATTQVVLSVYAKRNGYDFLGFEVGSVGANRFDLNAGTVLGVGWDSGVPIAPATITSVGNGWYRCSMTVTTTAAATIYIGVWSTSSSTANYAGDGTSGIYLWGAQLIVTNSLTSNAYQRIAAATDYDTAGFLPYLAFDGTDDSLLTNSVDFTATDKVTVWAGVRKLSDAAQGVVSELSATIASNNGSFLLTAPNSAAANYNWSSKGTTQVDNTVTTYTAPITNVVTGIADIAGASNIIRINGVQVGSVATTQGTGNFGNYPLYIGRRNNATFPFNGNLYSLIIRGAQSSAAQISSTETWVNGKTGAY
jgi:hypothetical protein